MIRALQLRFGRPNGGAPLSLNPGHMTVFVGPNNSGKTLVLRELRSALCDVRWPSGGFQFIPPEKRSIVEKVEVESYGRSELEDFLAQDLALSGWDLLRNENYGIPFAAQSVAIQLNEPRADQHLEEMLSNWLRRVRSCLLDGVERLSLSKGRPAGPLDKPPQSHLQSLFVDDLRRSKLQGAVKEAFGFYVLIDPTNLGTFRFCLADSLPETPQLERSLDAAALEFYKTTRSMDEASDGVKAYTGIVSAVLSTDFELILIDEPEAFLHPPLARRLGSYLPQIAKEQKATVFASTHSADFLAGCVQSGCVVDVVRLTYEGGVAGATALSSSRLTTLMRDPLLRSTGVLSALFYRGAVICEGDTDRAFYAEINERLCRFSTGGIDDTVFLNAQNWQTCANIVAALREMGIPAATIVDTDVLLESDFSKLLVAANVPPITASGMTQTRSQIEAAFNRFLPEDSKWRHAVKKKGIACLPVGQLEAARNLLSQCQQYGIFIVPVGEVEKWLPNIGVEGHGPRWLIPMFERMGSDPDAAEYAKPTPGDVWEFIHEVGKWISNPHRSGMPV